VRMRGTAFWQIMVFLFEALSENIGNYVSGLVQLSFRTFAYVSHPGRLHRL